MFRGTPVARAALKVGREEAIQHAEYRKYNTVNCEQDGTSA